MQLYVYDINSLEETCFFSRAYHEMDGAESETEKKQLEHNSPWAIMRVEAICLSALTLVQVSGLLGAVGTEW